MEIVLDVGDEADIGMAGNTRMVQRGGFQGQLRILSGTFKVVQVVKQQRACAVMLIFVDGESDATGGVVQDFSGARV